MQNPDFVIFGFKVFVYLPELWNTGESGNILSNNPSGVGFPNESKVLWPQPTLVFAAESFSGKADGLTGESSGQDSWYTSACGNYIPPPDSANIAVYGAVREAFGEDHLD